MHNEQLAKLAGATQGVYDRQGARFDIARPKGLHARVWIDRFKATLPPGAQVLDLGCGVGHPIAAHLIESGFAVTGVDFSHAMLALIRARFPVNAWHFMDMRALSLP
jgi:ubiquinone/menaquinone biosynthesis C-methylase UbiE